MANEKPMTIPSSLEQIDDKVIKYETFLSERLRPDLKDALEERDKLYAETAEFLALKNSIEAIKASNLQPGEPLKTKVDLGSNFYCQAVVPNPGRILVEVGLGKQKLSVIIVVTKYLPFYRPFIVKYSFIAYRLLCRIHTRRSFAVH